MGWIHRYVGLVLGAWLMLVGLSGATLVFYREIDSFLFSNYLLVDHVTPSPDIDSLLTSVKAAYPDRAVLFYERYGVYDNESFAFGLSRKLPVTPGGTDMSSIAGITDIADIPKAAALQVFVDPQSGKILGERPYRNWVRLVQSFHQELFVPGIGERIVGGMGLALLFTVIAGVVLWWRESKNRVGRSLRISLSSPMPRLIRDIHTVAGIYIALFLSVQALDGAMVADWFPLSRLVETAFSAPNPPGAPIVSKQTRVMQDAVAQSGSAQNAATPAPAALISANQGRDIALTAHPRSNVVQVVFPTASRPIYSVRLYPTDQSVARHARQVLVNARSAKIAKNFDPDTQPLSHRILANWLIWIHNGYFFGLPGRLIVLMTGIMLTLFFPTGIYIWYRKRQSRIALSSRRKPAGGARTLGERAA